MARGRFFYIILGGRFCFREAVQAVQGQDDSTPPPDPGMQRTTLVARWKLEIFFPTLSTIEVAVLASLRNCPKSVDSHAYAQVSARAHYSRFLNHALLHACIPAYDIQCVRGRVMM